MPPVLPYAKLRTKNGPTATIATEPYVKHPRQTGFRLPLDVVVELDRVCAETGLKRTEIVVAALRKHLLLAAPAETLGRKT